MESKKEIKDNHEEFKKILKECEELRWKKVNDYGLSYSEFGYVGVLVKLGDKYKRLKRLYELSLEGKRPNFESERDSLKDLVNYSVMALMELEKYQNLEKKVKEISAKFSMPNDNKI